MNKLLIALLLSAISMSSSYAAESKDDGAGLPKARKWRDSNATPTKALRKAIRMAFLTMLATWAMRKVRR